jgi:hypothetical protein
MSENQTRIDRTVWVRIGEASRKTGLSWNAVNWMADRKRIPVMQPLGEKSWRLVSLPSLINLLKSRGLQPA